MPERRTRSGSCAARNRLRLVVPRPLHAGDEVGVGQRAVRCGDLERVRDDAAPVAERQRAAVGQRLHVGEIVGEGHRAVRRGRRTDGCRRSTSCATRSATRVETTAGAAAPVVRVARAVPVARAARVEPVARAVPVAQVVRAAARRRGRCRRDIERTRRAPASAPGTGWRPRRRSRRRRASAGVARRFVASADGPVTPALAPASCRGESIGRRRLGCARRACATTSTADAARCRRRR